MIGHKSVAQGIVLERPSPTEEDPRSKVFGEPLRNWRRGMPLIGPDNPDRERPVREGQEKQSASFEEWLHGTLWSVAAP